MKINEVFDMGSNSLSNKLATFSALPPVVNPQVLDIEFLGSYGEREMFSFAGKNLDKILQVVAGHYYPRWVELHELFERNLNTPKQYWDKEKISGSDTETMTNSGKDTRTNTNEVWGYNDSSPPAEKDKATEENEHGHIITTEKVYGKVIQTENKNYNKEIIEYMEKNLNLYDIIALDVARLLSLLTY